MRKRTAMLLAAALLGTAMGGAGRVAAVEPGTVAGQWNQYATEALFNTGTAPESVGGPGAGQTPPVGAIHMAMVQIAVFDALNAIVGGYAPYLDGLPAAPAWASQDAAAATAAHDVLVAIGPVGGAAGVPAAALTRLDDYLRETLEDVPDGPAEEAGVAIGRAAAAAILADREDDNRGGPFRFQVGTAPGEWRPTAANGANDPFAWVKDVRPFTLRSGSQFMSEGNLDLGSAQYAIEYEEVKAYGSAGSTVRSASQTATAMYFTENPFTLFNRSFRTLVGPYGLGLAQSDVARLLAMTNVAGADALIDCWNNKALHSNWRPITAINFTGDDGNAATEPEVGWTSLVPSPPYPDNTSGYNCATGGQMFAAREFFGTDKLAFDLVNAGNVRRGYQRFSDVLDDTVDARVWLGIHFRFADVQGAWVGKKVGQWVGGRFFEPAS